VSVTGLDPDVLRVQVDTNSLLVPEGSSVDVPAQLSNYVCTEFGIVNLRGLSVYERAAALISIAHPDDREWLEKEARANGLLAPKFPVSMGPTGPRRYPSYEELRKYKIPMGGELWGFDWDQGYQSAK
jgi:acyl-CoA hydrolase